MFGNKGLILFGRFSPLLELPLTFEQRGLIDVGENVFQRNVIYYARTKKRRFRNWNMSRHRRTRSVRGVAGNFSGTARPGRPAYTELGVFSNQLFNVFSRIAIS